MFSEGPMILHSQQADGRHWFTSLDIPPLQIAPVAQNHCRVGQFLATLVAARLMKFHPQVPEEITLTRADVAAVPALAGRYPELKGEAGEVRVRLPVKPAPDLGGDNFDDDDDPPMFVTPMPPSEFEGGYDMWIMTAGRLLGVDAPAPTDTRGYEAAMANAAAALQNRLGSLRKRFLAGMNGANLGFKIGLLTRSGAREYVWVRATDWKDPVNIVAVMENQPRDCKGYKLGQTLKVSATDLLDYCVGSEDAGVVEAGLTQRIAEDYGLVLP